MVLFLVFSFHTSVLSQAQITPAVVPANNRVPSEFVVIEQIVVSVSIAFCFEAFQNEIQQLRSNSEGLACVVKGWSISIFNLKIESLSGNKYDFRFLSG